VLNDDSYEEALQKSMLFYMAQRSGPINDDLVPWRETSTITDKDGDVDLTGGWFDAGDHVKFGFPMAGSATNLIWGFLQWPEGYRAANREDQMFDLMRQPLDYFLKCWNPATKEFYGQVGNGNDDHALWTRPEDLDDLVENNKHSRPAYKIGPNKPGSDLAGETAAALAAGSIAFKDEDPTYSARLLTAAKQLYKFANDYKGKYSDSITDASSFYKSWSGYNDELVWSAAWLYKATGDEDFLQQAESKVESLGDQKEFSWDNKAPGAWALLYSLTKKPTYETKVKNYMTYWTGLANTGPCGIAWHSKWGVLRYAANTALIALTAATEGIDTDANTEFAKGQLDRMLGKCEGKSFVIGFGDNFPKKPHHRAASCPTNKDEVCDWDDFNSGDDNPNELTGALVGGPKQNGEYTDERNDYLTNEVTTDYNAGFQSVLAGLIDLNLTPDLTPVNVW